MNKYYNGWNELNNTQKVADTEIGLIGVSAIIAASFFVFWLVRLILVYGCVYPGACVL